MYRIAGLLAVVASAGAALRTPKIRKAAH